MKTMALAVALAALSLMVLEAGKDEHQAAGLHLPTEAERCYMQRGCKKDGQ